MQRNLIPLRTWRGVCLLDNYLVFLPVKGPRHNVRLGSGGPDPTSSLRPDARAVRDSLPAIYNLTNLPTERRNSESVRLEPLLAIDPTN